MVILINGIRSNPTSFIKALKEYNKDSSYSSNCDKSVGRLISKLNSIKSVSTLTECDYIHDVSEKYLSTLEDVYDVTEIKDTAFNKRMTSINANCISEYKFDNSNDGLKSIVSLLIFNKKAIKELLNAKYKFISVVANDYIIVLDLAY